MQITTKGKDHVWSYGRLIIRWLDGSSFFKWFSRRLTWGMFAFVPLDLVSVR